MTPKTLKTVFSNLHLSMNLFLGTPPFLLGLKLTVFHVLCCFVLGSEVCVKPKTSQTCGFVLELMLAEQTLML